MLPTLQELQWYVAAVALATAAWKVLPILWRTRFGWTPVAAHFCSIQRMASKVDRMEGEIAAIRQRVDGELGTNGGGSLKDQVTLIAAHQSALFDAQIRASFQADVKGNFISVNRAFERRTGFPARDLLGMGWANLLHPADFKAFMEAWEVAVEEGFALRRSCRIVTADNVIVTISVDAAPVKRAGRVIEWQGSFDGLEAPV